MRAGHVGHAVAVRIARTGRWLYDGEVEMLVDIVGFDFDWWHELARSDDTLEPREQPQPLGVDGYLYYVRFRHAGEQTTPTWVDSGGHVSVEAGMATAESNAPSPITHTCRSAAA
jgi:hypothetical protein